MGIPRDALKWRSALLRDVRYYWGVDRSPAVFFAQLHQESRWRETARSGVGALGIGQFMPGTAAMMQRGYNQEFKELCREAGGCPLDGRWAIRATVLFDRDLWRQFPFTPIEKERFAFTLAGYNSGPGWVRRERTRCGGLDGCRTDLWFENVERVCLRAESSCRETREYAHVILLRWTPLYERWLH